MAIPMLHQGIEKKVQPNVTAISPRKRDNTSNLYIGLRRIYMPIEIKGKPNTSQIFHPNLENAVLLLLQNKYLVVQITSGFFYDLINIKLFNRTDRTLNVCYNFPQGTVSCY